ncbi:MAG: diaminohydroxyphosphoribosylaminopyrimidine deaminase [Actinomycetota bacterium]
MDMEHDEQYMRRAIDVARRARWRSRPNPWVGALVVTSEGEVFEGATSEPGGAHAEIAALQAAGDKSSGSTLYCTLEPCNHTGRTGPCTEAIIAAGVSRVVIGIEDPDDKVRGSGIARLRAAGLDVIIGVEHSAVTHQLRAYVHHRTTGRPFVVVKMATTIDGRVTSPSPSERWLTGVPARTRVHELRADSDAILVGAGTVRADDPELTTRLVDGPSPRRVVLGTAPAGAKVHPCLEWSGDLESLLDQLGADGVVQLLVEGGPTVVTSFEHAGLIDEFIVHLAGVVAGGSDTPSMLVGSGDATASDVHRGDITSVTPFGNDLEIIFTPRRERATT